jgi:SH3-like domain-containing protein
MRTVVLALGLQIGLALGAQAATPAATPDTGTGPVTKLPMPRYVSLKTDRVNLREGPSKDHRTLWVFQRAGLPVEIVAEFENWRRIRDAEGTEGWVLHSLLSSRRTALVMPWVKGDAGEKPVPLLERSGEGNGVVAQLQPGVIANVKTCTSGWCRIMIAPGRGRDFDGFMKQDKLWGVYPNESVQ